MSRSDDKLRIKRKILIKNDGNDDQMNDYDDCDEKDNCDEYDDDSDNQVYNG
jgi:hypothetical protein